MNQKAINVIIITKMLWMIFIITISIIQSLMDRKPIVKNTHTLYEDQHQIVGSAEPLDQFIKHYDLNRDLKK